MDHREQGQKSLQFKQKSSNPETPKKNQMQNKKAKTRVSHKAKGTYLFPRKNKDELIENPFEILGEPSDDFEKT